MSNSELIERLVQFGETSECYEAADALAAADKRIAELEKYGRVQDPLAERIVELERRLDVAREAMTKAAALECNGVIRVALAQIGGDDAS